MNDAMSCSECYLDNIERRWTQVLLDWISKCIDHKEVKQLNYKNLINIINEYKDGICCNDLDKIPLSSEDFDSFIKYKFPILRLGDFYEANGNFKKLYILTSLLLYYFCTNSLNGRVDADICKNLSNDEQVFILRFCEALAEMEVTTNNIKRAIIAAFKISSTQEKDFDKWRQEAKQSDSESDSSRSVSPKNKRAPILKFKSSITVLPSVIADTSSKPSLERLSNETVFKDGYLGTKLDREITGSDNNSKGDLGKEYQKSNTAKYNLQDPDQYCQSDCACTRCSPTGPCCGDPGCTKELCDNTPKKTIMKKQYCSNWRGYAIIGSVVLFLLIILSTTPLWFKKNSHSLHAERLLRENSRESWVWICQNNFCKRVFQMTSNTSVYLSLSRCTLLCSGLQLWPYPIGYTCYSKTIIAIETKKLEYKFKTVPSTTVQEYLAEAFKLFLKDLAKLERSKPKNQDTDLTIKKMNIIIDIESDSDPKLRLNTDEAYTLNVETIENKVFIKINSASFCGVRHGLETLSQLILVDQNSGYLITLSNIVIKDAPSYKYRGLMVDTARNFVPVIDLMRTIDAMATCKLNTFHWRISDVTSFSLHLDKISEFYEYGPYDRSMVYTSGEIKLLVKRAGVRGIRILIEVAAPGPIGRPWSWLPETTCSRKNDNLTCDNILCLRLSMQESAFDVLQSIYSEIIQLTHVDDIFHLSDSLFSLANCYNLIDDRDGFLDKALERLKIANKGFLPRLPIIWYTSHLKRDLETKTWERFGIQLYKWDPNSFERKLNKFKVIHSSKWDLSCEMKNQRCTKYRTWQQMYSWKSWCNVNSFTTEGGESILWTDLVDSSNFDYHLWPRAAAVAERLWSNIVANSSANKLVYLRLDSHRWRMLRYGVNVQPIWPAWCSNDPSTCLQKVQT